MTKRKSLLEVATRYLEMGLAPIPCNAPHPTDKCTCRLKQQCVSPGKHPAIPWQRFQTKPIDADQLLIWFGPGGMYEDYNIGIVTGSISGNVFVVDVDCGPGKQGDDSLHELQMQHDDLPPTMETKTGSNGRHYFFRAPAGVRIITDKNVLGPGVDVRGEGGFVVAGGSIHANGNEYVCDFAEIADAPAWLLDFVTEGAHHEGHGRGLQESSTSDNPFKASDGREGVMVRVILGAICNHYQDHKRLPTLDELIEHSFPVYVEKVKARSESLEAEGRGISLFRIRADYQLKRAQRGQLKVLANTKQEMDQSARRDGTVAQALQVKAAPAAASDDDWDKLPAGMTPPTQIKELLTDVKPLKISEWGLEIYVGEPPSIEWLIEGVIPARVPMLLAAIGGLGKSFLLLDLAIKVAAGRGDWTDETQTSLGGKVVKHGKVVFLTAEDSKSAIHRRLEAFPKDLREKAKGNLFVIPMPDAGGAFPFIAEDSTGLHHTEGYIELRKQILDLGEAALLVVDPLQAFVHADITANPAAAQFWWSTMAELCAASGATVAVAHHMRKDGAFSIQRAADARQAIRGTTALVDGARVVYAIWSLPENEEADLCKLMDLEPGQNNLACGAVIKTNEFADTHVRQFKRSDQGLLIDCTAEVEELMSDAAFISNNQLTTIMDEVQKRWDNGAPFGASPKSRTNSFTYWLTQTYGLTKSMANAKMLEWTNKGLLVGAFHDKTRTQGLKKGAAGASSQTHTGGNRYETD